MADVFRLSGSAESAPGSGSPSGVFSPIAPLDESMSLGTSELSRLTLSADAPVVVPFGGVVSAHVVILKTTGGKVKATLTSADGAAQAIPVDSLLVLISSSVPFTAISLTRVAGTSTKVDYFLGEKAS